MVRSPRVLKTLIPALIAALVAATAPAAAQAPPPAQAQAEAPSPTRARLNRQVFDRVWNEVDRRYYDPALHGVDWRAARDEWRPRALAAPDEAALYAVVNGMLRLLDDPHAQARPPMLVAREAVERRARPVLGLSVSQRAGDALWRIDEVRAGSPAAEAAIEEGWRLSRLDGRPWGPETALTDGEPVELELLDQADAVRRVRVTPRVMQPAPAFSADRSRPGVLVLDVNGFEAGLGRWMGGQLRGLDPGVRVVLDLRANAGGLLGEAAAVLSCFLPRDHRWATRTTRQGRAILLRIGGGCGDLDGPVGNPLAVLVDGSSRSAAELTPAALQEAGRALVVGRRTAGAVLIAQDTGLPDGGRLTLSRADFVTAAGVRLEKRGVEPDIADSSAGAERRRGLDAPLAAALAALDLRALETAGRR